MFIRASHTCTCTTEKDHTIRTWHCSKRICAHVECDYDIQYTHTALFNDRNVQDSASESGLTGLEKSTGTGGWYLYCAFPSQKSLSLICSMSFCSQKKVIWHHCKSITRRGCDNHSTWSKITLEEKISEQPNISLVSRQSYHCMGGRGVLRKRTTLSSPCANEY